MPWGPKSSVTGNQKDEFCERMCSVFIALSTFISEPGVVACSILLPGRCTRSAVDVRKPAPHISLPYVRVHGQKQRESASHSSYSANNCIELGGNVF